MPANGSPGHNSGDFKEMAAYVTRIEELESEKATIMAEAMNKCRNLIGDIKQVKQDAKDEKGIPKKSLTKLVQQRRHERKANECREALEDDELFFFDGMKDALGQLADTPLGEAALEKAAPPPPAE